MHKKRQSNLAVIAVAAALIGVLLLDTWQVFRLTSRLTLNSGQYHLKSISGELEATVSDAKQLAMQVGLSAFPLIDDREELDAFLRQEKEKVLEYDTGCFNVYMAGTGWAIIPDFDMPEDYIATERDWYRGAMREQGRPYVTAPYVDAMTGMICYTVSVRLGDGDTVVGLDYTMDSIQSHIVHMYEKGSQVAIIVTGDGIIAGCSDESLIGRKLSEVLPEYSSIFSMAKIRQDIVCSRIRSGMGTDNLFADASGFGWYLIFSESDWSLFQDAYLQMIATIGIALLLLALILVFLTIAVRRERAADDQIRKKDRFIGKITGEMTEPLRALLGDGGEESGREQAEELVKARTAARQILNALHEIEPAWSREEKKEPDSREKKQDLRMNVRFRARILLILLLVIVISFCSNLWVSLRWGNEKIRSEVSDYDYMLTEWVGKQKSILDMFCSVISTNPQMLSDYEATVGWLDRITQQYPEISVTYMTSPEMEPTVFMNNGWLPPEGWHVEERQWYIDTMASESGWSISTPYYDDQTGLYCITFAERVYDASTGKLLGTFGIDFFMDKLIDILGGSYSDTGYAFLSDTSGVIINHPYGGYQMTESNSVNVAELGYGQLKPDGQSSITIRDYDGTLRILIARRNEQSHFVIYETVNFFAIYAPLFVSEFAILALLIFCAVKMYRLLSALIRWQDSVNEQMQEAADTAIAAGKAKSRFLAQMSHEIRTPINAVLGMNEMILRRTEDGEILDYASSIQTAGRTLLSLINSILDFSKIEEGKMQIVLVEYDTSSFINNLVVSISERARDKGLKLNVDIDETLPSRLYGDDLRLSQVIMNILTNAVKYTEKGEVTFTVSGSAREDGGIDLYVSVRDTGIGIREEDIGRLFESFERLDEVRNHSIEGTGLGMSIVTRLLDMMGSRLLVESEYGKGSCFSFTVRQDVRSDIPIGNYMERMEKSRVAGGETLYAPGAQVLVVDDNDMNLKVAQNLLMLFGITPDLAGSGYEAIECARRKTYHVIFMDHMMPKMDGIETLNALRKEKLAGDSTKVIALTANAVNGIKEEYLAAGFDGYLSKPIEVSRLEKQLRHSLPEALCRERETPAENPAKTENPEQDELLAGLERMGCDTESGLRYAAGDRKFYTELLHRFADSAPEAETAIRKCREEGDLHNYEIRVHALKSTARQIGLNGLADLALAQESAARENDAAAVGGGADELLGQLHAQAQALCGVLGKTADPAPENPAVSLTGEETLAALKEAASAIGNFEAERAAGLLQPLKDAESPVSGLSDEIAEILAALEDFDTSTAEEKLKGLLSKLDKALEK